MTAEVAKNQARSIKFQLTMANLPLAKEHQDLELLCNGQRCAVRELASCPFVADQRYAFRIDGLDRQIW